MKKNYYLLLIITLLTSSALFAQSYQHLVFDGVDDHVRLDNASDYLPSDQMSMTGWFYNNQLNYGQGMMGLRDDAGGNAGFYMIQLNNGQIECRFNNSTNNLSEVLAPSGTIVPNTWQHYAFVYDGSNITLYLNGDLLGQAPASGTFGADNKPFVIGRSICCGQAFYQEGNIDEVSLWSKALTPNEISDIYDNEIDPTASGLELYYKMDQGVPGDNNQGISTLKSETGTGDRDAALVNFDLTGTDSNFGGELDASLQVISFPIVPNKLTTDAPFNLEATASSELPVSYSLVSGPATVNGNTVTLTGQAGTVMIAADQAGDGTITAANTVTVTFEVIDPMANVPNIDSRSPYMGADVQLPSLDAIRLAAYADIPYPELFEVANMEFVIDNEVIPATDYENGFFSAWWTPPAYGSYTMTVNSANNFGAIGNQAVTFDVSQTSNTEAVSAVADAWLDFGNQVMDFEVELPVYTGAYESITGVLDLRCPPGGCGEWDRIANIYAKGYNGEWVEIIRYITPYSTACSHTVDLTDFASILHGKTTFRIRNTTFDNGYEFNLDLTYNTGTPTYKYSTVVNLWNRVYPFGDPANLQPVPDIDIEMPANVEAAKLKLVSTGHGWGENNTGNAAEFHQDRHHIWVDGVETFQQDNWSVCNPNPDGCSPQNGTFLFNRAGWCPGAAAKWFDYDMAPYLNQSTINMGYIFNENYVDNCHANNPNCFNNITCPNCDDGFNPQLHVASTIVLYANMPIAGAEVTGTEQVLNVNHEVEIYPNPSKGEFTFELNELLNDLEVKVFNTLGQQVYGFSNKDMMNATHFINLNKQPSGMYLLMIESEKGISTQKIIIE